MAFIPVLVFFLGIFILPFPIFFFVALKLLQICVDFGDAYGCF